jgi:hypothetical protein
MFVTKAEKNEINLMSSKLFLNSYYNFQDSKQ